MRNIQFCGAVAAWLVLVWASAAVAVDCGDVAYEVDKQARKLGKKQSTLAQDIDKLSDNPRVAVRALVEGLHVVPRRSYWGDNKTPDVEHVLACLRALHYLTGETFTAKTSRKLSDDDRDFLDFNKKMHDNNPSHKIHFFGVWMSRDSEHVAPEDAQREIIRQWNQWLKQNGETFTYTPAKKAVDSMDDWYFYG